jgi:hypothetical protein
MTFTPTQSGFTSLEGEVCPRCVLERPIEGKLSFLAFLSIIYQPTNGDEAKVRR